MQRRAAEAGDTLLVIDDQPLRRSALEAQLRGGRRLVLSSPAEAAAGIVGAIAVDVAVLAFGDDPTSGVASLGDLRARSPDVEVIALVPETSEDLVSTCLRRGAVDVVEFPRDASRLPFAADRALERRRLVESEALYHASRVLVDARTPEALSAAVAGLLRRALATEGAVLLLADDSGELPDSSGVDGADPWLVEEARRAAATRLPMILWPDREAPRWPHRLYVPLTDGSRAIGVLVALRADARRPFRGADLDKAALLAAQAQLALHNVRLSRELVRAERLVALGELLAGVSHEISNPIAFVRTNIRYVSDALAGAPDAAPEDPAELRAALQDANEGLDRLSALVQDLRVLGKVEASTLSDVDVREAVDAAVRIAGAELKRCQLSIDVAEHLAARSDPGRFRQALVSLLVNAAHAVLEGPAPQRRVRIGARAEGEWCVVEVSDAGPAVPEALRDRVFEPFAPARGGASGSGLGLTLARRIAEAHGGSLSLLPSGAEGAAFELRLPLGNPRPDRAAPSGN